jgi:hypothetical protein
LDDKTTALMNVELAELEVKVSSPIKLAVAHAKLKEIICALDPSTRHKRLKNGFTKILLEAEMLANVTLAVDKLSDEILRDIYHLIDLITVEIGSADMIDELIREADKPEPPEQIAEG